MKLRTRIAPTPSGFLHIGNAFSFLLTSAIAREAGGDVLLRIDDMDVSRFREVYLEDIFRSLDWLGIDIDEGPSGPEDFNRNFSQRHRLPLYQEALDKLAQIPEVFGCQLSRSQIKNMATDDQYPLAGREQMISLEEENTAWRIQTPQHSPIHFQDKKKGEVQLDLFEEMRDFVVRKKDGKSAYQLTSLVDDLHYNINFIVRGEDLIPSTAAQLFLAKKLGKSSFSDISFLHHPLLLDENNNKLSKSEGATSLKEMREAGKSADEIRRKVQEYLAL